MESRTLRYRTNVPFCNACSEKRDSNREVILILKLAYRTNLSGWKLFFSWNVLARSSESGKYPNESREMWRQIRCQQIKRKVERQIPINVASLFYGVQHGKCRNYSRYIHRIRIVEPFIRTPLFPSLVKIKDNSKIYRLILLNDVNMLAFVTFATSRYIYKIV